MVTVEMLSATAKKKFIWSFVAFCMMVYVTKMYIKGYIIALICFIKMKNVCDLSTPREREVYLFYFKIKIRRHTLYVPRNY